MPGDGFCRIFYVFSSVYVVLKKSSLSFWTALLGAGSNVILTLILIPRIGVMGAALATLARYILVFFVRAVSIRRLLPFPLISRWFPRWASCCFPAQAPLVFLLLILNARPLLLTAKKTLRRAPERRICMILTAIHGFCMALADSVPGVSGGTIAFILGFYDRFLNALHSLFGKDADARKSAIIYLLKLGLGWIFGMGACVLTLASFPFVLRAEKESLRGQERYAPFALLGLLLVVLLTLLRTNTVGVAIRFAGAPVWMLGYIFLSGAVAITAMVLPGISGSTILLIAGVYLPAIQAIRAFLGFDFSVFPGLCALGLGVIAGVGLSIHAIRAALRKYRSQMVWLILGLMAGSLYAIVMGPAGLDAPQPPVSFETFDLPGFALGVAILLGLELLRKWTAQHPVRFMEKNA